MTILQKHVDMSDIVVCFTDGSAINNSKNAPAGWAVYLPQYSILLSKGIYGTNNYAELTALSVALFYTLTKLKIKNKTLNIFTDSEYCIKVMKDGAKITANIDIIKTCRSLIKRHKKNNVNVVFKHVQAHTGKKDYISKCNDIVDKKARQCALKMTKK